MKNKFNNFKDKFISFLVDSPKKALILGLILFVVLISGVPLIKSNFTPRIWFTEDSPQIQKLNDFEKRFGGDQVLAIGFYTKNDIFDKEILSKLEKLTEELWLLPTVVRVDSLTNFNHIKAIDNDIDISPLIDNTKSINEIRANIKALDEIKNNLIAENYNFVLFFAQLKPMFGNSPDYSPVLKKYESIIKKYEDQDHRFIALGNVAITHAFREISKSDNIKTIPVMFGFIFIILLFTFRSFTGIFAPLVISGLTIGPVFGLMGYLGIQFNSILAAIPGILVAICLADTIHVLSSYYHERDKENSIKDSIKIAMDKNYLATILTTITTGISFFTVSFTELLPIHDLGVLAASGTVLAWLNTYIFLPVFILLLPEKFTNRKFSKKKDESTFLFSELIWKFKTPIVIFFVFISIGSFITALDNEVNSDPLKYFDDNTQVKKDYVFTKKFMPGIRGIEVEVDSGVEGGVKDPKFLKKVESYTAEILKDPDIIQVNSIIDTLKQINMKLNNDNQDFNKLPDSQGMIAEALVLYTMGLPPGQGIENIVSMDNRYLKLKIKWTMEETIEAMSKDKLLHSIAKKHGLNSKTGGFFPIYVQVNDKVVDSFFRSMTMAVILVSIIILFVFKNFFLAFLSMLPNIIPLSFGAAYMALNNIYIDIGTSIVAAICLGIAVDDTIHFVTHFVQNKEKYKNTQKALDHTFRSTGKALILTTALLVVGFGSFIMADFLPNHYFGILCALVLSLALLTDLLFLPALLSLWYRKERNQA